MSAVIIAGTWSPDEVTIIDTVELSNVNVSFSFLSAEELDPEIFTVTSVVASEDNPTISLGSDSITGYYSDAFNYSILYLNKSGEYETVSKFGDIADAGEICSYNPSMETTKTYTYTVTATGDRGSTITRLYTAVVNNDWTAGSNALAAAVAATRED